MISQMWLQSWTGIPVKQLTEKESERLLNLEEILHRRVVGQNEAVNSISGAIRRGRVGLKDPKRPIASFIFLGPAGVGKTELSNAIAEALFNEESAVIRLDMSEYMEAHSVSKMIGSPPGYVGFDDGGQLTERVRRKPYSVVLFDEIEKAHTDVFNILLQIVEDGKLTDSQGRSVDFKNTLIIMTSNIGARIITEKKSLGFSGGTNEAWNKNDVMSELRKTFRPEFLNRIDDIVIFNQLNNDEMKKIAAKLLSQLQEKTKVLGISLAFSEETLEHLASIKESDIYGVRPMRRMITSQIENLISEKILTGDISHGDEILLNCKDGKFSISVQIKA